MMGFSVKPKMGKRLIWFHPIAHDFLQQSSGYLQLGIEFMNSLSKCLPCPSQAERCGKSDLALHWTKVFSTLKSVASSGNCMVNSNVLMDRRGTMLNFPGPTKSWGLGDLRTSECRIQTFAEHHKNEHRKASIHAVRSMTLNPKSFVQHHFELTKSMAYMVLCYLPLPYSHHAAMTPGSRDLWASAPKLG